MAEKLGLYVHIPFCRSKCDYCDFYSLAGKEGRMDDYQKALLAHMKETAPLTRGWQVDTVYFGGGTPAFTGEAAAGGAQNRGQALRSGQGRGDYRGVQPGQCG